MNLDILIENINIIDSFEFTVFYGRALLALTFINVFLVFMAFISLKMLQENSHFGFSKSEIVVLVAGLIFLSGFPFLNYGYSDYDLTEKLKEGGVYEVVRTTHKTLYGNEPQDGMSLSSLNSLKNKGNSLINELSEVKLKLTLLGVNDHIAEKVLSERFIAFNK